MFYHPKTNKYYSPFQDGGFTIDGNQYPPGWLNISSLQDKLGAGLLEVITEGEYKDDRFFFNTEELVGNIRRIISTPKPQEMVDAVKKAEIDSLLAKVREARKDTLNILAGVAISATILNETDVINAYKIARQSLLDITKDLPSDIEGIKLTLVQRYQDIVFTAITSAPSLEKAFSAIDL
jgi:hypothetical protein